MTSISNRTVHTGHYGIPTIQVLVTMVLESSNDKIIMGIFQPQHNRSLFKKKNSMKPKVALPP